MYDCPHCGQPAVGLLRKSILGPAASAKCKHCSGKITVPIFQSMAVCIAAFAAMFLSSKLTDGLVHMAFLAAIVFATIFAYGRWVPLIKK